jgi:hypothetical protein
MKRTAVKARHLASVCAVGALAVGLVSMMGAGPAVAGPTSAPDQPSVIHGNSIGGHAAHATSHIGFGLPTGNGFLSVFQTIPAKTLSVTVGAGTPFTLSQGDFNFGDIAPNTYPVTAKTGPVVTASGSIAIPTGGDVTSLVYLGATGTPTVGGFPNNLASAPAGQSRMVFRNTGEGGPVDVLVNGVVEATSLVNDGTSSVQVNLPGEPLQIIVKNHATQTTVARLANAVLTPGLLVNEFFIGSQTNGTGSLLSNAIPLESGYRLFASDGGVFTFPASLPYFGSEGGKPLNQPIVGAATDPLGLGYWMVASDGGIFTFGDTGFFGSMGAQHLNEPIVGMAATPDGDGYWLVASDGGIFAFGDAVFQGSMGAQHLNKPIVGMAATPDGKGYWLVASDGGMFSFGDAVFQGSMGGQHLNQPVVGMASTADGGGYWLVASDGGMFSFGDAVFFNSMGGQPLAKPIVGMMSSPDSLGYWLVASDGGVFSFGDAHFMGSTGNIALNKPIVAGNSSGTLLVG